MNIQRFESLAVVAAVCIAIVMTTAALGQDRGPSKPGEEKAKTSQPAGKKSDKAIAPNVPVNTVESLERAIRDLIETFGEKYAKGKEYLARLEALKAKGAQPGDMELEKLSTEALLANPLLGFEKLILIRRDERCPKSPNGFLGLPWNFNGNCALPPLGYDNEIMVLSPVAPGGAMRTLYRPDKPVPVADLELHWDADRLLFSSVVPGTQRENRKVFEVGGDGATGRMNTRSGTWHIFEIGADGKGLRQVTRGENPDVDNYEACYLPDGRIIFNSNANYQGTPCRYGNGFVANLCIMDTDGGNVRQLCFDQDMNYCPTVLHDGSVMYLRWEYSGGMPHIWGRILFRMRPDGTNQQPIYGGRDWPTSYFFARPVPNHPTKVVGIVTGHHGVPRMGELVIMDTSQAQFGADNGVVQQIPGYARKVEPLKGDAIVEKSWPKFLHPWPLSDKYFLVSMKPNADALWGIYLVDVFDNALLLAEQSGQALFEPRPLKQRPRPPVIPDRVDPHRRDAVVYMTDVYRGRGLEGVPRGSVKLLRLISWDFGARKISCLTGTAIDGPFDIPRILGTVPVEADGSAAFRVPANTPISVQPLDGEGKAVQLMRSWFTAMPGETLSCVGCHERNAEVPGVGNFAALRQSPSDITPWYGPARGFSFEREVQPVLDRHCVSCHDGKTVATGKRLADLRNVPDNANPATIRRVNHPRGVSGLVVANGYPVLRKMVNCPGCDRLAKGSHLMKRSGEFHANTSQLIQMLKRGHHEVQLDAEAWDRLITWIDLNAPLYGTWGETLGKSESLRRDILKRRFELMKLYGNLQDDPEEVPLLRRYGADLAPIK